MEQNDNSRSHQKHSFTDALQRCHGIWLASKLHNTVPSWFSAIVNSYDSSLNLTEHGECISQHLVGNMRRQILDT